MFGQTILIVEDEPLIAQDVAYNFEHAGANVVIVHSCSAAILDGMIGDAELHQRLTAAGIPYMVYSGYEQVAGVTGTHVNKPATREALLNAIKALIDDHEAS